MSDLPKPEPGSLLRIDAEESTILYEDVRLTNGTGFSPDGSVLYHSDSLRRHVIRHEIDEDGSCINECPGGADRRRPRRLVRRRVRMRLGRSLWRGPCSGTPEGRVDGEIELPQARVTSVCFGGADLRDFYIATADGNKGEGHEMRGAIFRTRLAVAGLPPPLARV